jgi:hypothetical protein
VGRPDQTENARRQSRRRRAARGLRQLVTEKRGDVGDAVGAVHQTYENSRSGWIDPPSPPTVTRTVSGQAPPGSGSVSAVHGGLDGASAANSGLTLVVVAMGIGKAVRTFGRWFRLGGNNYGS